MKTLIKNGTIVTATETRLADVLIEDDKVIKVEAGILSDDGMAIVDATGLLVLPGGVDAHVHLDLAMAGTVSADDHYSGTKAAAFGGTTTVIDFISQDSDDLLENVRFHRQKADPRVTVDYSFHMNITHLTSQVEEQIPMLVQEGITSVKVFTAYNNRLRLQDGEILKVMRIARDRGILTMLHAENGDVIDLLVKEAIQANRTDPVWHAKTRPAWGATEASLRGAALAAIAGAPLYIVHMNTGGEVDQLQYARAHGVKVMGETCPQYLFFSEEDLARTDGAKFVCSPPLRSVADQRRIWQGLQDGTIQTIATDHCSFFYEGTTPITYEGQSVAIPGKELGKHDFTKIPNGLPGVGDRLPVLWTKMVGSGEFTPSEFVALTSTNPAKIFGLYPQKGTLQPGSDADVVIWDPQKELTYGRRQAKHRTDYNLYEGWKLKGMPVQVMLRGKTLVKDDQWFGIAGQGKFLSCRPFGEVL